MATAPKKAAATKATTSKQETYMPTDQPEDVIVLLTAIAHQFAVDANADDAAAVTRAISTIEALRKEVKQQAVMVEYQEQCKQLAEDKLRQFLLS